jgi:hypothetical protein
MIVRTTCLAALCVALTFGFGACSDEELPGGNNGGIGADAGGDSNTGANCIDNDSDGYFGLTLTCAAGNDCDDTNSTIFPGASEICGDGIDQNCSGLDESCGCEDVDGDGFYAISADCPEGNDCNDLNSAIFPGNPDLCGNGVDEDCSGADLVCQCVDGDNDNYFAVSDACPTGNDCDDMNPGIHPGATDTCGDGIDQDCLAGDVECVCVDGDGDGYGEGPTCLGPDCYDDNKSAYPGATEICGDGIDQDCNGADEVCPTTCEEASDTDGDGYGSDEGCDPKDCDDTNENIFPGASEICGNDVDENCDGIIKECPTVDCIDEDGDGYGVGAECLGTDCNDAEPSAYDGATEVCGDGVDNDCVDGDLSCGDGCVDGDGDGSFAISADCAEGTDCNDAVAAVNIDAIEVCEDMIDNNCSGADAPCEAAACTSDADCDTGNFCDATAGACVTPWEWYAPVVYLDTNENAPNPWWDYFTTVNYDGDWIAGNNWDNVDGYYQPAQVYYSFVKTATHWYITYYYYFPVRWSTFGIVGTQYENALRSVMLVVRQNGDKGILEVMETSTENSFYRYTIEGSELQGLSDGTIKLDNSSGHDRVIVYIDDQTHNIRGTYDWDTDGFPGDNGLIFNWSLEEGPLPDGLIGEFDYTLISMYDELWTKRFDVGNTKTFDPFGQFAGDDASSDSRAPWALYDSALEPSSRRGEILFDPATMLKRHFNDGWGPFKTTYTLNPYAVRVDVTALEISKDADPFPGQGGSDPYINLYMNDGTGKEFKLLGEAGALISNWQGDNSEADEDNPETYLLKQDGLLVKYWFHGMRGPSADAPHFGIEVRDDDGVGDDWLMDPEERDYVTMPESGTKVLDYKTSKVTVTVTLP